MIALCIVLLLLTGLILLPLDGIIAYDAQGFRISFALLGIPVKLPKKKAKKKKKKKEKAAAEPKPAPKGGSVTKFLPYLRKGIPIIKDFLFRLSVPELTLWVCFGGRDDPASAAIAYGAAWGFIGSVMNPLRQCFSIKKENVGASCDFTVEELTVVFSLRLRTNPGQLLLLLWRYVTLSRTTKTSEKAVSNHESSLT